MPKKRTATEQTRSHGVSDLFLHHELLITETDLLDWMTTQHHPNCRRLFVERRYFDKDEVLSFERGGRTFRLKPDSGAMIEVAGPDTTPTASIWFKELDRGTESFKSLKAKFQLWDHWAQSVEGEEYLTKLYADHGYHHSRPTFKLQVIAHANSANPADDARRLVWLFTAALFVSPRMRRRVYLTTAADMHDALRVDEYKFTPAAAPIWWRLHDAKPWLADYDAFIAELPKGKGQKPLTHMRQFIADRLPAMPRHSLFPPVA